MMNNEKERQIDILLAGNNTGILEILGQHISRESIFREAGLVCDPAELGAALEKFRPDVLLLSASFLSSLVQPSRADKMIIGKVPSAGEESIRQQERGGDESVPEGVLPNQDIKILHPFLARIAFQTESERVPSRLLLKAAVDDIVTLPQDLETLSKRIISTHLEAKKRKALAERELYREKQGRELASKVLTFWGSKGGVGTTRLAVAVLQVLSRVPSYRSLLIDLDLQLGDAGLLLEASTESAKATISDLLAVTGELNRPTLENALIPCGESARFLPPPQLPEEAELVSPEHVHLLLPILKNWYDPVIIDLPAGFSDVTLAALDHTDILLLVVNPDISSLQNADKIIAVLRRMKFDMSGVHLVINGYRLRHLWPNVAEIESMLKIEVAGTIPWEKRITTNPRDYGGTNGISMRGKYWRSVSELLQRIFGVVVSGDNRRIQKDTWRSTREP